MSETDKTRRALAALDAMAATWAAQVNARDLVRRMLGSADPEGTLLEFVKLAHAEGLYAGRISHKTTPVRLSDPEAREDLQRLTADITSTPEKARAFLRECGFITADGKLSPQYGGGQT